MNKKLSTATFIITQILILLFSLAFLGGLYYMLNIQYQQPKNAFYRGGPVTSKPSTLILQVDQPDDNVLVFQPSVVVSGNAGFDNIVLIISGSEDLIINPKENGSFSTVFNLDQGINQITVYAFDKSGNSRSKSLTVYYSKEKI